jgi:hypothetical protein
MLRQIRWIGPFWAAVLVLAAVLQTTPASAVDIAYVSDTGNDNNPCTAALPCATIQVAADAATTQNLGIVRCINSPAFSSGGAKFAGNSANLEVDCAGTYAVLAQNFGALGLTGANAFLKIRNLTISGRGGGYPAIIFAGSGVLVLENCVFEDIGTGAALDIEPSGPLNVVIRNSRLSNNASGILFKPAAGGSINATLDHVTIATNAGGGIKVDTTNGPVTTDITDSVVSGNSGNGINAVGGASQNIVSIKNSVVAKNAAAGVQANGASAGILVQTTLFDQNSAGATSVVNSGHISTYGNNSIIGSAGSGFTATAGLQ